MPIHILDDAVASQIAAGEVIERPASVVKELMENALDAGARQVEIRIVEAGRRLIEVTDDGCGISPEELSLAVARHATSKLQSAADLFHITTLGFRGEALASIASVSRLTLTSRTTDSAVGGRIQVEGGKLAPLEAAGGPPGTLVRVEDLFYNVPARLKFLKRDLTERQQIDGLVTRYALAYPHVRFHLFHEGRPTLQTSGKGDRREVLASLYGVDVARQMLEVDYQDGRLSVTGFISPVALTRSNRRELTFFVNGRWVQDASLSAALLQAYHTLLMVGRFPIAALFINLPPDAVDVNVHPAKAEVRFRDQDEVFSAVSRAARRALLAYSPAPSLVSPPVWQGGWRKVGTVDNSTAPSENRLIDPAWEMAAQADEPGTVGEPGGEGAVREDENSPEVMEQSRFPAGAIPLLRLVGQVGASYLVAEGPDGLYLIDQHAAHERVLFERFLELGGKSPASQALLEPVLLTLPPAQAVLLEGQLKVMGKLGFEVEVFGPNTFRIRAIPAIFAGADPASVVRVVVEDFEEDESPLQSEVEARLVARICKRSAVKAGQILSVEEQRALLRDLERCQSPRTCPHGRPTMIHLPVDVLERQFGRRGAR
ncbi:DNA mismatch repair protein MutL [Anaerolinea thermolimosa]|uniref:DNA mismatch repair endonuclease MutL n=1 Tax=Anaerolinea thermolimosa TaxID=229919 RepID=UPI0007840E2B|nr:DNA mismatch repair endonuclease MutL [Anaerolinea thermolimosa]GAP07195.1 DNA mismatch repair protein MutL [Anaerolinea thermolimosa]